MLPTFMNDSCDYVTGQVTWKCIPLIVAAFVKFLMSLIATFSLIWIMWGGYEIVLGPTGAVSADDGKKRIQHAIVGLVVSILGFALINLILDGIS